MLHDHAALDNHLNNQYSKDQYLENIIRHGATRCFAFQTTVLGTGVLEWQWVTYSAVFSVAMFVVGAYVFRRAERRFADVI